LESGCFCSSFITGLVPVIPVKKSAALHMIGMAGTRPVMTPMMRVQAAAGA
jgi:hypothetical protein